MNQKRFDNLTRTLAMSTSRRQALKLLGGGIAGGLFAAFGGSTAQAALPIKQSICLNFCKDIVEPELRGKCMSTCMPCDLDTSSLCLTYDTGILNAVCCPGQSCTVIGTDAFCGPPPP